jgi:hypothetical protein
MTVFLDFFYPADSIASFTHGCGIYTIRPSKQDALASQDFKSLVSSKRSIMPLKSDITLDYSKFDPASVSELTKKFNENSLAVLAKTPLWWEVGVSLHISTLRSTNNQSDGCR